MNRRYVTTVRSIRPITMVLLAMLALPAAAAQLDTNELAHCVAIAGSNERLACFDALAAAALGGKAPVAAASASAGTSAAQVAPTAPSASPAVQTAPASAAAAQSSVAAAEPASPARTINPDDPANFGLSPKQLKVTSSGPGSIKAVVSQMTEDRRNNVIVVLDNGQTWLFIEPEPRLRPGDSVTIKRASLGSFLMTTPSRHGYRVERLK